MVWRMSFLTRFCVSVVILFSVFPSAAAQDALWQFTNSALVQQQSATSDQDKNRQQVSKLADRLSKNSPSGLPSLQWIQADSGLLESLQEQSALALALPNSGEHQLVVVSREQTAMGVTISRAIGTDVSLSLSQLGQAVSGSVVRDGVRWQVTIRGDVGIIYKNSELPNLSKEAIKNDGLEIPKQKKPLNVDENAGQSAADEGGNVADIVVVYSEALVSIYGSRDGVLVRIANVIDATNEMYANSNVDLELNVVDIMTVDYDPNNAIGSEEALYAVSGFDTGMEFYTHARRQSERLGADFLVSFRPYVGDGVCGIAWVGSPGSSGYNPTYAVSHTSLDCGIEVNAHELGHNMGLQHSRRQDPGYGYAYHYALGHGVDNVFTTIMAYPQAFGGAGREYKFSSPDLTCANDYACGVDHTDRTNGADAARALRLRRDQITSVRLRQQVSGELLTVSGINGAVQVNGQTCPANSSCEYIVATNTEVTVTAQSNNLISFARWRGGSCSGQIPTCELTVSATTNVIAEFEEYYIDVPVGQALDNNDLDFYTSETYPWRATDLTSVVGNTSLRSPIWGDRGDASVGTIVQGYGDLTFSAKVSSDTDEEGLYVLVNGETMFSVVGNNDWQQYTVPITDTLQLNNEVVFLHDKNMSDTIGTDLVWIDNVQFEASDNQPLIARFNSYGEGTIQSSLDDNTCSGTCDKAVETGQEVTFTAVPDARGEFLSWAGACRGQQTECRVTFDRSKEVHAYFSNSFVSYAEALDNSNLVFESSSPTWEVTNTSASVGDSSVRSAPIADSQSSAIAVQLEGAGELSFDWQVSSETSYDFLQLYINGGLIAEISGERYWNNYSSDLGDGLHQVEWVYYKDGSVSSGADAGYLDNVQWTGRSDNTNQVEVTVEGDLGFVRTNDGFYCRSSCSFVAAEGDSLTFYAQADSGANFSGWQGACSGTAEECSIAVEQDITIIAAFDAPTYTVNASSNQGGSITPAVQSVIQGEAVQLLIAPLAGYQLATINGCDGVLSSDKSSYQTAPVFEACTVHAEFERLYYEVNFELGEYGTLTDGPALSQQLAWGEAAQAPNFTVASGWNFAGWSDDFSKITSPLTVTANYQQIEGNNRVDIVLGANGSMDLEPVQYVADNGYLTATVKADTGYTINRQVGGTCPAGEWASDDYRWGPITESCTVNFEFYAQQKSSSLLMILSAIVSQQQAQNEEEEQQEKQQEQKP